MGIHVVALRLLASETVRMNWWDGSESVSMQHEFVSIRMTSQKEMAAISPGLPSAHSVTGIAELFPARLFARREESARFSLSLAHATSKRTYHTTKKKAGLVIYNIHSSRTHSPCGEGSVICQRSPINPATAPPPLSSQSLTQPQMTIASRAAQNNRRRTSSPAGERSSTSASSGARCVPGAPAGRMSSVVRWTDSAGQGESEGEVPPSQSQSQRGLRTRRSTTCNESGRPCASVARVNLACARTGRDHEGPRPSGGACARKTRSKVVRRGFARTRRAPQARRASSPVEGTMRRVNVRN